MIKNLKNAICCIIILLLATSCLFLYSEYRKNSTEIKSLNQKIDELEKQKQELTSKLPLGWKEYTDKKYKFKIWYPEKITDNIYGTVNIILGGGNSDNIIFYLSVNDVPLPQILTIYIYKTDLNIKEAIKDDLRKDRRYRLSKDKNYSDSEIITGIQQIKSGNLDLYKFREDGDYYIKKGSLIFAFIPGDSGPANYQQMYETMVKSFRFTE